MGVTSFLAASQNVDHNQTGKRSIASYLILLVALSVLVGCPTALEPNDSAERNYDLDAPVEPGTTPPVVVDEYDTFLQWTWTGAGGGSGFFRARLNHNDVWDEGVTSPWPNPGIDYYPGVYIFEVQERDDAGNWSEVSGEVTTVKVREPTITASPTGYTNINQPSFTWTQWSGPPVQYGAADVYPFCLEQRVGGKWIPIDDQTGTIDPSTFATPTPGQGTFTATRALPDGEYRFCVAERNEGGSRSDYVTATFTIDTTPPAGPEISGATFVSTAGGAETYTWTGDSGDTVVQYDYWIEDPSFATVFGPTTVPSGSPQTLTYDFPNGTAGTYTIYVSQTDEAGNVGTGALPVTVEDTPGLTIVNYTGAPNYSNIDTVQFNASSAGTGMAGVFQYRRSDDGGTTWGAWAPTTPVATLPDDSLAGQPDGTYTYQMREQRDDGVTYSDPSIAVDLIRDTAAPAPATTIIGAPPSISNNANPTFSVDGEGGAVYQYSTDGGATFSAGIVDGSGGDVDGTANGTVAFNATLTDGPYTLVGRVTDAAGNISDSTGYNFTIDTTPPPVPVFIAGPADGSFFRQGENLTYTVSTEPAASVEYSYDGGIVSTVVADGGGNATFTVTTTPPDGPVLVGATAADSVGNISAVAPRTVFVDDTMPVTSFVAPSPLNWGEINTTSVTYQVNATDGGSGVATVTYDITGPVNRSGVATNLGGGTWQFTETGLADGTYTVASRATDNVGNVGAEISRILVVDTTPPSAPTTPTSAQLIGTAPNQYTYDLPVFTWGGIEADATVEYSIDGGGSWITLGADVSSYGFAALSQGFDYQFVVRQTDTAGNVSAGSPAVVFDYISEMVARWQFAAGAEWLDNTGNGNFLTAPPVNYTEPTYGTGPSRVIVDSNFDQLIAPASPTLTPSTSHSVSFWYYATTLWDQGSLIGRFNGTAREWVISAALSGQLCVLDGGGYIGGGVYNFGTGAIASQWNHIVVTFDTNSSDVSVFMNGSFVATRTGWNTAITNDTANIVIGSTPSGFGGTIGDGASIGELQDVRIFTGIMSPDEVSILYNGGTPGIGWPPP